MQNINRGKASNNRVYEFLIVRSSKPDLTGYRFRHQSVFQHIKETGTMFDLVIYVPSYGYILS